MNPLATSYELVHYFETAKPKLIAVDGTLLPKVEAALKLMKLSTPPAVIVLQEPLIQTTTSLPQVRGKYQDICVVDQDLLTRAKFPRDFISNVRKLLAPYDLTDKDNTKVPVAMCFSSGTSGKPKGVVLSHHTLIAYLLTVRSTSPFLHSSRTREVFFPSFAHIYGLVSGVLLPAFVGCYLVAMAQYDFLPYLRRCADIRATIVRLVPATAIRMTKDPEVKRLDLKSIHTIMCSSASLAAETAQELQKILSSSVTILNGYGMTEGTIAMLRESQSARAGSVGRPVAGASIRIVDDNFEDVVPGTDGQCLVKGPTVFMGYKDNDAETAATFHDGWLCTGDIVKMDGDGFLWLTGRKKELIKYKGNQIAPVELEAVLLTHPLVAEAGVCGITDGDSEVPLGCVELSSAVEARDIEKTLVEIKRFVDERVAPYKRLRGGLFHLETIPKTSTGKIVRRQLPEMVAEKRATKVAKL